MFPGILIYLLTLSQSIARALYVEATVTILDDPFSSLDVATSALIRIRLISDGHAAPNGRALVMTSSMSM